MTHQAIGALMRRVAGWMIAFGLLGLAAALFGVIAWWRLPLLFATGLLGGGVLIYALGHIVASAPFQDPGS